MLGEVVLTCCVIADQHQFFLQRVIVSGSVMSYRD